VSILGIQAMLPGIVFQGIIFIVTDGGRLILLPVLRTVKRLDVSWIKLIDSLSVVSSVHLVAMTGCVWNTLMRDVLTLGPGPARVRLHLRDIQVLFCLPELTDRSHTMLLRI
jgi:hypothetical protein